MSKRVLREHVNGWPQFINVADEASELAYDNMYSGLSATNVQGAIDEVSGNVDTLYSAPYYIENDCINGTFDVWQRGSVDPGASGYVTADRFAKISSVYASSLFNKESFETGQTDVPGNPKHYSSYTIGTAAEVISGYDLLKYNVLDGARKYSGNSVTIEMWVKGDAGKYVCLEISRKYDTALSDDSYLNNSKELLTGSWQKISTTFSIPSLDPLVSITDINYLAFRLWFSGGSNHNSRNDGMPIQIGTFYTAEWAIYAGSVLRDTRRATEQETFNRCQEYYHALSGTVYAALYRDGYESSMAEIFFHSRMIQVPSLSYTINNAIFLAEYKTTDKVGIFLTNNPGSGGSVSSFTANAEL